VTRSRSWKRVLGGGQGPPVEVAGARPNGARSWGAPYHRVLLYSAEILLRSEEAGGRMSDAQAHRTVSMPRLAAGVYGARCSCGWGLPKPVGSLKAAQAALSEHQLAYKPPRSPSAQALSAKFAALRLPFGERHRVADPGWQNDIDRAAALMKPEEQVQRVIVGQNAGIRVTGLALTTTAVLVLSPDGAERIPLASIETAKSSRTLRGRSVTLRSNGRDRTWWECNPKDDVVPFVEQVRVNAYTARR
jgi:hypothetical protein